MTPAIFVSISTEPGVPAALRDVIRYDRFVAKLLKPLPDQLNACHIALGITGEAGELADAIKKEYIYNKPRDLANIIEELGDLEFYLQAAYDHYGLTRDKVIQDNATKLQKRYAKLYYTDEAAIARADKQTGE
jgi:NTP pyrophosphatase (non-canonical NTP hydrolase)